MGSQPAEETNFDVIVIGGGFSGCYQLHKLREAGFSVHLFEAGSALGGIWYWNCYPGARVDTEVPCYQYTATETWKTWNWKQRFPGRDEIEAYFRHVDDVWDLSRDISYSSRVRAVHWDQSSTRWKIEVYGSAAKTYSSQFTVLCTGFASSPYTPRFKNLEAFKGEMYHTGLWPQGDVDLKDKRIAVIGTGASGVQLIQNAGLVASQLTVFQRTPNTAIPMTNPSVDAGRNEYLKDNFPQTNELIHKTFAGFDYEFAPGSVLKASQEERTALYERLFHTGGLHFWLGTWMDVLFDQQANDEAYEFWRQKTLPRIHDPQVAEMLAPKVPKDPFGTKRISLEQGYFEVFNRANVTLVSTEQTPIAEFTQHGITTADGRHHNFDIIIFATGFDAVTGGITQLDVRGLAGLSIKDKWQQHGTHTHLGMTTSGFPNLFFTYGPQAPTAFATGPSAAEAQGDWILACLRHLRRNGLRTIDATPAAEREWRAHVNDIGAQGLFSHAKSWYYGDNIPGKPREALNYMAGLPKYKEKCWASAEAGYAGFVLA